MALKNIVSTQFLNGGGVAKSNQKLNTGTSVVDYLKSKGQDSSLSARAQIAKDTLGIKNYTGTATQNIQLLSALKNGTNTTTPKATNTTTAKATSNKPAGNTTAPKASNISGVDSSVTDKINSTYSDSKAVTGAKKKANNALDTLTSISAPSVSQDTWNAINTPFQASSAYTEAMSYTNSLLEKLSSGRTSYTDQIKDMMSQIQNRDKFSYDVENDTLFQQALASAMGSGQQAMQDTIGQASALTGGYGSTYATSAGNQAYNAYIEDAYNNLPEYYQMALEAYNMEGQEMYNQLNMLNTADATEYGRTYDSWNANFANAQNMYSQEYGAWQDSVNNAYNSANLQLQQQGMAYDQAYNTYGALQDNANTLYAQEYQKWSDEVNNAFNYAGMQNSDYWNTANFDESVRQYDTSFQEQLRQYDTDNAYRYDALEQNQNQFNTEMAYKNNALAQDQSNWEKEYALQQKKANANNEEGSFAKLTTSEIDMLKEVYMQAGGGDAGDEAVDRKLSLLGKNNVDNEALQYELHALDEWVISEDTPNWFDGDDNNDSYTRYGETKTFKEIAKEIENSNMSEEEKAEALRKLRGQNKK